MKNRFIILGIFIMALALAGNAYAVGQGGKDDSGKEVEQQVQTSNQGDDNQIQNREQEETQDQNKSNQTSNERRSQVANAVQEMLQLADRNGGLGEQVRVIAQAQNQNQQKLEASLEKVKERSGLAKFLVGPNYGEIKNAEKVLEQNREQIRLLNQEKERLINIGDQQILAEQIQLLEQINAQIQNELNNANQGFSLLGWMFKLFN